MQAVQGFSFFLFSIKYFWVFQSYPYQNKKIPTFAYFIGSDFYLGKSQYLTFSNRLVSLDPLQMIAWPEIDVWISCSSKLYHLDELKASTGDRGMILSWFYQVCDYLPSLCRKSLWAFILCLESLIRVWKIWRWTPTVGFWTKTTSWLSSVCVTIACK